MKTTSPDPVNPAFFLGIDVGKADLFCHFLGSEANQSERFDNTAAGIDLLTAWLAKHSVSAPVAACLEQTGHYAKPVAKALAALDLTTVHLVNPRCIKAFGNQRLRRNKSDSADARLIARFIESEHRQLQPWTPPPVENEELTELSRYAESLVRDSAILKTRCEAITRPDILRSIKRRLKIQEKELADIRKRINAIIAKTEAIKRRAALLTSIPGIGQTTCHILLAELPAIELFSEARQLAAWAGVTPRHFVSGSSGKSTTPITKVGSANLRRALYLPAMTAKVFNPLLKTFADRLKEDGKKPKPIIIAVMRKLLHQIYGVLKSGEPFNPDKTGLNPTQSIYRSTQKIEI